MTEAGHPAREEHAEEHAEESVEEHAEESVGESAGVTGNAQVDEAVRGVLELGDRPVEEHVEVFEQAHSALRGALNDAAAGRTAPAPGAGHQGPRPTPPGPRPGQG